MARRRALQEARPKETDAEAQAKECGRLASREAFDVGHDFADILVAHPFGETRRLVRRPLDVIGDTAPIRLAKLLPRLTDGIRNRCEPCDGPVLLSAEPTRRLLAQLIGDRRSIVRTRARRRRVATVRSVIHAGPVWPTFVL